MTKKEKVMIGIIVGLIGFSATQTIRIPEPVTKEVIKEVAVQKTVEVEKNQTTWRELKSIDDQAFKVAAGQMKLCGVGFKAASSLDAEEMERVAAELNVGTEEITELAAKRTALLEKLGY